MLSFYPVVHWIKIKITTKVDFKLGSHGHRILIELLRVMFVGR